MEQLESDFDRAIKSLSSCKNINSELKNEKSKKSNREENKNE